MANGRGTVAESAARQLANATKTRAQWAGITPRWLIAFLPWTPVEAGIYRVNRVKQTAARPRCRPTMSSRVRHATQDPDLPETFVDYEENPREYLAERDHHRARRADPRLRPLQPPLRSDPGAAPPPIEKVKETQESELINNPEYGLLTSVAPSMTIEPRRDGRADA